MMTWSRVSAFVCALAFGASFMQLCPCTLRAQTAEKDAHPEEQNHHQDAPRHPCEGSDPEPAPCNSGGGCGSDDTAPGESCCCSAHEELPVDQPVIQRTSFDEITILLPADRGTGQLHVKPFPRNSAHPPPNEGFKAWPDVPLFLQHSSLLN